MKLKLLLSALLISLIQPLCLHAQEPNTSASDLYLDANSYFFYEDYEEALALYLQVIKEIPRNANLNYRIGICYLNLPGRRNKAIPFLESATANTTKKIVGINGGLLLLDGVFPIVLGGVCQISAADAKAE